MIIYQNWVVDFFKTIVMNPNNHHDTQLGFGVISNNPPTND